MKSPLTDPAANALAQLIESRCQPFYPRHSRAHPLNGFPQNYYVKRDDELSCGVSGSKMRKYLSLISALKEGGFQEAVLIGGGSSNNIVGLSQLLIEEGIKPTLFLCGRQAESPSGNLLISQLLVPQERIHWHDSSSWSKIAQLAESYASQRADCCVIPEGASCAEALPGALTLAMDIMENEHALAVSFDHIICDAGTGMMAAALILGNSLLQRKIHHHVILLADDKELFRRTLNSWKDSLEKMLGMEVAALDPVSTYKPSNARSFGAVNAGVKKEILRVAREEGILTDPIYSSKLFAEARNISLDGNVLLIHSGGALGSIGNPRFS